MTKPPRKLTQDELDRLAEEDPPEWLQREWDEWAKSFAENEQRLSTQAKQAEQGGNGET